MISSKIDTFFNQTSHYNRFEWFNRSKPQIKITSEHLTRNTKI